MTLFEPSERTKQLQARLKAFMDAHVYTNEKRFSSELTQGTDRWRALRVWFAKRGLQEILLIPHDLFLGRKTIGNPFCRPTWTASWPPS